MLSYLIREFRMKYFKDIEILYKKFYIIFKYCPISNNSANIVITDMNNIELSSISDSNNEVYNINHINNRNNIVNNSRISDSENSSINISDSENSSINISDSENNSINISDSENSSINISDSENSSINISDSENYNIVTTNLVNSSIDENRGNLSNFLNNECVYICVRWYRLYNFLLGGKRCGHY